MTMPNLRGMLVFAPAGAAAAAVLWLGARAWLGGDDSLAHQAVAHGDAEPAARASEEQAPAAADGSRALDESRAALRDTRPTGSAVAPSLDAAFHVAADYFAFAQAAAPAAIAGDGRAQYRLGQVLEECNEQTRIISSMGRGGGAADVQAYLDLVPGAGPTRGWLAEQIQRCGKFFYGSPLDGLGLTEDARAARYWLDRARASRDALAVMDRAIEESLHQHFDSMPPEHRAELLADVRTAVASREPAALYKIGTVFSQAAVARDTAQGTAWLLAACEAGFDCSNANPIVGQGCAVAGICDPAVTLQQSLERSFDGAQLAQLHAASRDILERIERGDWGGLQPYLETQ